jgi:PAS domain S-box-containing protein
VTQSAETLTIRTEVSPTTGGGRSSGSGWLTAVAGTLQRFLVLVYAAGLLVLVAVIEDWHPTVTGDDPVEWDELLGLASLVAVLAAAHGSRRVVQLVHALREEAADAAAKEEQLFATTREWIWSCSRTGVITSSSRAVGRILGREPAEVVGTDMLALLHPADRPTTARQLSEPAEVRLGWTGWVRRWRHSDGSYRWLESDALPVHDESGVFVGFSGADRDVTDDVLRRQQSDEALADTASKRRRIQRVLDDPSQSLTMVFQPIVRLEDGEIAGAEALARFTGEIDRTPDVWFADAAEVGLGEELEILAIRTALAAAAAAGPATCRSTSPRRHCSRRCWPPRCAARASRPTGSSSS